MEKSRRNKAVPVLQELQACNEVASNRFTKKKCVTLTKLLGFAVLSPLYCRFLCEWKKYSCKSWRFFWMISLCFLTSGSRCLSCRLVEFEKVYFRMFISSYYLDPLLVSFGGRVLNWLPSLMQRFLCYGLTLLEGFPLENLKFLAYECSWVL